MNYLLLIFLTLLLDYTYSKSIRQIKSRARKGSASNEKRIVCYYTNWASSRSGKHQISPEDLDPFLCTHLNYAFVTLEEDVGLAPYNPDTDINHDGFIKLTNLKKLNPKLKVMLSVGGSNEGSARFSKMVSKPELRQVFVKSARSFLMQYGFDGLDLVWQYPGFLKGSLPSDKENYVLLVKEIKHEFKNDFGLSMVVPKIDQLIKIGYDLPALTKYLDFINIVTYDYHDAREPIVNHIAPLYRFNKDPERSPNLNVDATIMTFINYGVDPAKITMGIPLYGVTYTLEDPKLTKFGSTTADEGEGNRERGALDYNVICDMMKYENWTIKHVNKSAVGPYAFRGNLWVGYDDEDMVRTKARYAVEKQLGGLMFWSIDKDDFRALCGSKTYPLIKAGKEVFLEERTTEPGKDAFLEERGTAPGKELFLEHRRTTPGKQVFLEERRSGPGKEVFLEERRTAPGKKVFLEERISGPGKEVFLEERRTAPGKKVFLEERRSGPGKEVFLEERRIEPGKELFLEERMAEGGKEVFLEERMTTNSKVPTKNVQIIPPTTNFPIVTSPKYTRSTFSPGPHLSFTTNTPDENVRDYKKYNTKVDSLLNEPEIKGHKNINTNRDIYLIKNFTISVTNNNCILKPPSSDSNPSRVIK